MSDGALVIARHAETKRDQLSRAVGNLHSVGATILGTIITMTPSRGRGVYEYKYYYETDKSLPQMQQATPAQPPVQQPPQHQAPPQPQPAPYVRDEYPPQQYGPNGGDQQEVPAYQGAPAYQGDQSQQWNGAPGHYGNEQQAGAPVPTAPKRTRRYRDDQEAWSEADTPRDHTQ
jgi:receptor protein-tyrosine kinase